VLRAGAGGTAASARPSGALPATVSAEAREQEQNYMRAHGMLPEKPASGPAN